MLKIIFFLGLFWLIQALVQIAFKLSSDYEHRFLLYFCAGHAIGVPSLWFLVQLYKEMNPSVAFGLSMGGAFLAAQLALFLVFRPTTSAVQWVGALAICFGMVLLAAGGPREAVDPAAEPAELVVEG